MRKDIMASLIDAAVNRVRDNSGAPSQHAPMSSVTVNINYYEAPAQVPANKSHAPAILSIRKARRPSKLP